MVYTKDYTFFSVLDTETIRSCLQTLQSKQLRTLLCVSAQGVLRGTFSLGDFSRWIVKDETHSLDVSVMEACNKNAFTLAEGEQLDLSAEKFNLVPILDSNSRVVGVYTSAGMSNEIELSDVS